MSFPRVGEFLCTVIDAEVTYPKFPVPSKNDPPSGMNMKGQPIIAFYDVCLKIQDDQGNFDFWHGEMSNRDGVGNFDTKEKWEQTLDTLQQIGFNVTTMDELYSQFVPEGELTKIPNMIGLSCIAVTKEGLSRDGRKTFINVNYIKGVEAGKPQGMSLAQIQQMFAPPQQQAAAPAVQVQQQTAPAQQYHPAAQQPATQQPTAPPPAQQQPAVHAQQTPPPPVGGAAPKVPNPYAR